MPALMDFLDALHQGVWEVIVPKDEVTEPLVPLWTRSAINIPRPGTIASYRNGQYHAHETVEEYRVHLDRYDPEKNPIMHLVDDAPLVLMIVETLETLAVSAQDARRKDPVARIADLRFSGGMRMVLGGLLIATGILLFLLAFGATVLLFEAIVPAIVVLAGIVLFVHGVVLRARREHGTKDVIRGIALMGGGLLLAFFWILYVVLLLGLLAVWFLSSAAVTLVRVVRTRGRIPQGLAFTVVLGVASLLLGYWAFVEPERLVTILVMALGAITSFAGIFLLIDAHGLWNAARLIEAQGAGRVPSPAP